MAKTYPNLMKPLKVTEKLTLKNRLSVAPTGSFFLMYGEKGDYTFNMMDYLCERARGGFGLITLGAIPSDMTVDYKNPIDDQIAPLYAPKHFKNAAANMLDRVHAYGTKVFIQLSTGHGRMRTEKVPSPLPYLNDRNMILPELTREEIQQKIDEEIKTAKFVKECGFDGVEVHAMHWGYLLDQFAQPFTNHRTDEYGGDLDGRLLVCKKIVEGIKRECGADFPVSIRMGLKWWMEDFNKPSLFGEKEVGRTVEDAVEIAKKLESYGYDMLNCNSGTYDSFYYACPPYYQPYGYNVELARQVKAAIHIPIFLAGKMDDPDVAEEAVASGATDGVALARGSLADPAFAKKLEMGCPEKIHPCISCQNCIKSNFAMGSIQCSVNPNTTQEFSYQLSPAIEKKKIMVVGAGVAGMEAARAAKLRGHDVEIYEATGTIGGHLNEAGSHPFKTGIHKLNLWYQQELKRLGVPIHLNTPVTADFVKNSGVDSVILAVGSYHFIPRFVKGYDHKKAALCYDVLMGERSVGENVVVVGGGLTGSELAYDLARYQGKKVTLVEALPDILSSGPAVPQPVDMMLRDLLDYYKVEIKTGNKIVAVNDTGAVIEDNDGVQTTVPADDVVFCIGLKPNYSLREELMYSGIEVFEVGDGKQVGNIRTAVADAYEIARKI